METILGVKGPNFVMLAADTTVAQSIIVLSSDERKIYKISDNVLMAVIGRPGDSIQFKEFINKNLTLYKMRNGYNLSPKCTAHYTRSTLASYLRTQSNYAINMILAGYDEKEGPMLFFADYLANAKFVDFATHGYGGLFCSSILKRNHHDNITIDEAYNIMKKCVAEIHRRLIINMPTFNIVIIDKEGIRSLPAISVLSLAKEGVNSVPQNISETQAREKLVI